MNTIGTRLRRMDKKELAIFIPNMSGWKYIEQWPENINESVCDKFGKTIKKANDAVKDILKELELNRVYLGNEFCEYLIPSISEIIECYKKCKKMDLQLTLVTPLVSTKGLVKIDNIFQRLYASGLLIEIVFNDWGVGKLLQTKYPKWDKLVGRTLDKMNREPRLDSDDYQKMNIKVQEFLQDPPLLSGTSRTILNMLNVQGVELDCVPQGYERARDLLENIDLKKSIYFPFYCVTSGRLCMMRAMGEIAEQKWNLDVTCKYQCQKYNQIMQKFMIKKGKQKKIKLLRKGNAVFGVENSKSILGMDIWDRFVWQPQLPM